MAAENEGTQTSSRQVAPGRLELVRSFLNTHDYDDDVEQFGTPDELRAWLAEQGLLDGGEPVSEAEHARALELREALRALCLANNGLPLEEGAVATLNRAALAAPLVARFSAQGGELAPTGGGAGGALATLLAIVLEAMLDGSWSRMKACPAEDCLWVFYDHSRNRSGHWCSMAVCGNRAKARAYRMRHRMRGHG